MFIFWRVTTGDFGDNKKLWYLSNDIYDIYDHGYPHGDEYMVILIDENHHRIATPIDNHLPFSSIFYGYPLVN